MAGGSRGGAPVHRGGACLPCHRHFPRREGADFILRGLRSVKDFEYERDIAVMNKKLSGVETVLLFTDPQYSAVSSSVVRELLAFGKDVSEFLPH